MKFNIKKFKNNISFFVVCLSLIVILLLLSLLGGKNNKLDKETLSNDEVKTGTLVINEIMSSNKGVIASDDGNLYDYIEIYNGSDKDINLKNYGLSDEGSTAKFVFPETIIGSKKHVLVFLSGNYKQGLYANFKLKSSGNEVVSLLSPNGKVLDAVETVALDSNTSMGRNPEGKWVIQSSPTPGYANTIDGHKEFLTSIMENEEPKVVINEILANNKGNFKNENGEYSGYIEIKNISSSTVDISNYSLSNDEDVSFKWQFPSLKLSSNEVVVVYTNGTSNKSHDELSTSFKLNSKNGSAVLSNNKGKVIDRVNYENLANGMAYIRENDKFLQNNSISPGFDNTVDGIKDFQKKYLKNPKDLIINEVMNSNSKYLSQNGGNYYDWIELYNNSNKTINLNDYCLTTSTNSMCMYKLPKVELKKGEYYIIMASGNEDLSNDSYYHANFKISDTESIYITKSNNIIDSMFVANIPIGYSMGKSSSSGLYYFSTPTPKKENSNGTQAVSYVPSASMKSGLYNDSKGLEVTLNGSGKIYYTLDGSTPTTSSKVYSSPLTIKKTTVLRIMSKEDEKLKSNTITYSYIVNENHTLSVMSIAIDQSKLNNVDSHMSLNSTVIEPCDVELLELDGSGFKIGAGLKLFGGSTRSYRKKSYEIKFKKEYGSGHLEYKVFDTVNSSMFESLVLRTGSQDEFAYTKSIFIRDIVATSLMQEHTKVDVQAYKPVVLYLNGKYWGIYFIREKVDENFISNHYNVKATETNTDLIRIDGEVKLGTNKKYNKMISWIDSNSLSNKSNYNKIKEQIDIENLCDFWIGEIWGSNYDIVNTRFFSNPEIDNGKWKFIFYDLDSAYYNVDVDYYKYYTNSSGIGYGNFSTFLLRNLMKSSEFKQTFLERLSYNLKNTWNGETFNKKIDEVIAELGETEIKRNLKRWDKDTYSEWKAHVQYVKDFANNRNKYMISQAKSYFNLSDKDVKKYFGDIK